MQTTAPQPKGWYSRNYLPHCDTPGLIQAITFRLADALPKAVMERLEQEAENDEDKRRRIEAYLDTGHGCCWLSRSNLARIVENALLHFDGENYRLIAWCIMPNHVHTLIETKGEVASLVGGTPALPESQRLASIVHSWKSFSAHEINRVLGRQGIVWQREYYDRYIRDDRHLAATIKYIHENPVKAGLAAGAELWPFSSARF
ncbi:MAG: REP-associated tyrosine transposase [Gammaproteobacteria bacterium]